VVNLPVATPLVARGSVFSFFVTVAPYDKPRPTPTRHLRCV